MLYYSSSSLITRGKASEAAEAESREKSSSSAKKLEEAVKNIHKEISTPLEVRSSRVWGM